MPSRRGIRRPPLRRRRFGVDGGRSSSGIPPLQTADRRDIPSGPLLPNSGILPGSSTEAPLLRPSLLPVALVETLKCALSLAALWRIWGIEGVTDNNKIFASLDEISVCTIPAALYLVKNLLQYYIFAYVDAPSYQILKNFNIISTGVLYRIILKRNSDRVLQTPLQGWMMAIVMALLSGFAGVYTEKQKCIPLEDLAAEFKLRTQLDGFFGWSLGCGRAGTAASSVARFRRSARGTNARRAATASPFAPPSSSGIWHSTPPPPTLAPLRRRPPLPLTMTTIASRSHRRRRPPPRSNRRPPPRSILG